MAALAGAGEIGCMTATYQPAPAAQPAAAPDLPFHRLALAGPRPGWWRPVITLLVSAVTYLAMLFVAGVALALAWPSLIDVAADDLSTVLDLGRPGHAAVALALIAAMLPALAVGLRVGEGRRLGTMSSVAGRLRRPLLGRYGILALLVTAGYVAVVFLFEAATGALPAPVWSASSPGLLACALALVPIQAAAEEYAFRALPQQVLGAWLRSPWWGILTPVPVFVLGHGYNLPGQVAIAGFAVAAGILTWRTGGLEAAIALHVVNNVTAFVLAAVGLADPSATTVTWPSACLDLAMVTAFTLLVLRRGAGDTGR